MTINPPETPKKQEVEPINTIVLLSPFLDGLQNPLQHSEVPANTWGSLLSTLDVMAVAIKHQVDKQDIQVDLLNIMAKYFVGIDSKLQALNDLILQAKSTTMSNKQDDNVVLPRPRDSRLTSRARDGELETLGVEGTVEAVAATSQRSTF
ncbi:hypothetical protein NDU88_007529 [Pleurodeles waltl]|uniref:Uncharacterized protein n=1 Tax=Pleurodeles waltl TaxID=8319 RepID=A0AAV7N3Y5_PLEWA|nr:hypothetical protein NDU88_007529 [Pleurodeles waltl]